MTGIKAISASVSKVFAKP